LPRNPKKPKEEGAKRGFSELQKNRAQPQQKGPKIAPVGGWGRVYLPTPYPRTKYPYDRHDLSS